jgi:hypothetical protein
MDDLTVLEGIFFYDMAAELGGTAHNYWHVGENSLGIL